jgi:hypothetical protein
MMGDIALGLMVALHEEPGLVVLIAIGVALYVALYVAGTIIHMNNIRPGGQGRVEPQPSVQKWLSTRSTPHGADAAHRIRQRDA